MLSELTDDVLDVVFIDQDIGFHYGSRIIAFFHAVQDLLLVMERNLGVRDKNRRDEGMGNEAFCTEHTLDGKTDKNRIKFNRAFVMAVTDETSFFSTGTFDHVKLEMFYCMVIKILKIQDILKNGCLQLQEHLMPVEKIWLRVIVYVNRVND